MTALMFSYFSNACWVLAALLACAFVFRIAKGDDWLGIAALSVLLFITGLGLRYLTTPESLPPIVATQLANAGVISPVVVAGTSSAAPNGFAPHLTPAPSALPNPSVSSQIQSYSQSIPSSASSINSWVADMPAWLRGLMPPALRNPDATAQAFNQLLVSPAWQRLMANQALWQQFPTMSDQDILNSPDVLMLLSEPGVVRLLDIWSGNSNPTVAERNTTLVELLREAAASGNSLQPNMPAVVAIPALISAVQEGDLMPVLASPYGQMLLSSVLPGSWSISFSQSGNKFSLPGSQDPQSNVIVPDGKVYRFQMPDGSWRFSSVPPSDGRPYEEVQQ